MLMKTIDLTHIMYLEGVTKRVWLHVGPPNPELAETFLRHGYFLLFLRKTRKQEDIPILIDNSVPKVDGYEFDGFTFHTNGWDTYITDVLPNNWFFLVQLDKTNDIIDFVRNNIAVLNSINIRCTTEFIDTLEDDPLPRTTHWLIDDDN